VLAQQQLDEEKIIFKLNNKCTAKPKKIYNVWLSQKMTKKIKRTGALWPGVEIQRSF
jgi:hypothetical protein